MNFKLCQVLPLFPIGQGGSLGIEQLFRIPDRGKKFCVKSIFEQITEPAAAAGEGEAAVDPSVNLQFFRKRGRYSQFLWFRQSGGSNVVPTQGLQLWVLKPAWICK